VTLRRVVEAEGKKPRYRVVKSKPYQLKRGSELKFKSFDLCPYRYYGRLEAFHKPLCHHWERKAARKLENIRFKRVVKTIPKLQKYSSTSDQGPKKLGTPNEIIGLVRKDRGLLFVNANKLSKEQILKLADGKIQGASLFSEGRSVEGQQIGGILGWIWNFVTALLDWQREQEQRNRDFNQDLSRALNEIADAEDPWKQIEDYYGGISLEGKALTAVIDGIADLLMEHRGISDREEAIKEAKRMILRYVQSFPAGRMDKLVGIPQRLGVVGIVGFLAMKDAQQYAGSRYYFPEDPVEFFDYVTRVASVIEEGWDKLIKQLLAALIQASLGEGDDQVFRLIARTTITTEIFYKLSEKGWEYLRYGMIVPGLDGDPITFDFYAFKPFTLRIIELEWNVWGFVEPYLHFGNVHEIITRIERAVRFLNLHWQAISPHVLVQVVDRYVPTAKMAFCAHIENRRYGTPVIVVTPDGGILCHSKDITVEEVLNMCNEMGLGHPCRLEGEPPPPTGGGAPEEGQEGQEVPGGGEIPPGIYSIPIGDLNRGACGQQTVCLL
jgi:hypothetical protein